MILESTTNIHFIYLFITFGGYALNLRDASMKQAETYLFKKPSFRWRREKGRIRGNLRKQAWTGNQMHKSAGTENQTQDSLVQSERRYATLICFPYMTISKKKSIDHWYWILEFAFTGHAVPTELMSQFWKAIDPTGLQL